ncbi:hypothetical protein ABW19_dt0210109 [Dactylella cylindrospora]|nr:hypothetical protein ABW19_dt0210109 [Dactylella cylindrospora]
MATLITNTLTVPEFERPIRFPSQDPSRPPSSHSMRRSMSEESLHKITLPLSRESPFAVNMPPSPARTPTNRSQERLPIASDSTSTTRGEELDRIYPVQVSITTDIQESITASKEEDSPTAGRDDLEEYIQQTADILSSVVKDLQSLDLNERNGAEQLIAANLRLLRTLKDRHSALDKVERDIRKERSQSGPYTSINRAIYFDTPGFTPPQASRITFKDGARRNSDDMDGLSTTTIEWSQQKEDRLSELEAKVKSANRAWSEEQNHYLEELEQLRDEKRKHKKKLKVERRQSIKLERSQSMSHERDRTPSSSRERASSADTKRRLSLGFVPKPLARASSSNSFIERIFKVGK